jgi:hypothetical protein
MSGQQFLHYFTVHIGKPKISSLKAESQFLVIQPKQVKHGGMQVMNVN